MPATVFPKKTGGTVIPKAPRLNVLSRERSSGVRIGEVRLKLLTITRLLNQKLK